MYQVDPVKRAPDLVGKHNTRAWRIDLPTLRASLPPHPSSFTCVAIWCIEAPWAHPFWHSYTVTLAHLRKVEGMPPAEIVLERATHQFWLHAMNPDRPRGPFIDGKTLPAWLEPVNFAAQFIAADDADAIATLERGAVAPILDGSLSPDTDYRRAWIARFGDNMVKDEYRDRFARTPDTQQ